MHTNLSLNHLDLKFNFVFDVEKMIRVALWPEIAEERPIWREGHTKYGAIITDNRRLQETINIINL